MPPRTSPPVVPAGRRTAKIPRSGTPDPKTPDPKTPNPKTPDPKTPTPKTSRSTSTRSTSARSTSTRSTSTRHRITRGELPGGVMLAFALGCPADVEIPQGIPSPTITQRTQITEADPRVQRSGEDLYPTKTLDRASALQHRDGSANLGSGRPDESNGVCRLFAPKLPQPECCADNVGFDAPLVRTTCGLNAYLGESFDGTCGHYFAADDGKITSFRLSRIAADSVPSAAQIHFRQAAMQRAPKPDDLGVFGVIRSQYSGWNWAFIPGWDGAVRQLTWPDGACDDAGAKIIVQKLIAAPKPDPGTARPLVPQPQY